MTRCPIQSGSFQWAPALPAAAYLIPIPSFKALTSFLPVDVYIPGCPPRPEDLIDAVMQVQEKIASGASPKGVEAVYE